MKKVKNKNRLKKTQERNRKRKLKEKERKKTFHKIKLKRKAKRDDDKRAENATAKLQREIEKIKNKEAHTTYKKEA
jgi:hypothetical protein|tara:strand:- start:691 stop:918 length:228 start_codon:yes stop_codon:yes gene_type:complete